MNLRDIVKKSSVTLNPLKESTKGCYSCSKDKILSCYMFYPIEKLNQSVFKKIAQKDVEKMRRYAKKYESKKTYQNLNKFLKELKNGA